MSNQHKKRHTNRDGLDPEHRYDNNKKENRIQCTRKRDT